MPKGMGYQGRGAAGKKPTSTKAMPSGTMKTGGSVRKVNDMRPDGIKGIQHSDAWTQANMGYKGSGRK